uniref:Knottin scorpion toxin-like domain-containing protein n=1 Tax=Oryza brachyantha TaxID=4533 RepID=J3N150_ORYBR
MAHRTGRKILLLAAMAVMVMLSSPCHAADVANKCYIFQRCTLNDCNNFCVKLGVKNPQVTCKLTVPGGPYKDDTCCCYTRHDKTMAARRLLTSSPDLLLSSQ